MVYLMTLFAEWSEWMGRRLSIRRIAAAGARKEERHGSTNFGRENYEEPFFLDYTKHPTRYHARPAAGGGIPSAARRGEGGREGGRNGGERGISFRETFDFIYRREIVNIGFGVVLTGRRVGPVTPDNGIGWIFYAPPPLGPPPPRIYILFN